MKVYVVIEDVDDYPECGGGEYPDAIFLKYNNAKKYAKRKQNEADVWDDFHSLRTTYKIETWETADEGEEE